MSERERFNREDAPLLAKQAGFTSRDRNSDRFAYFSDRDRLCMVAGNQEVGDVALALAYGMTRRGEKALTLVLPEDCALSTLQRTPWFTDQAGIEIWLHDGREVQKCAERTRDETIAEHSINIANGETPGSAFVLASRPAYLGERSERVFELVEWATKDRRLDPGHRQGERSWHCMGQKVLSIQGKLSQIKIRAGIHDQALSNGDPTARLNDGDSLVGSTLEEVITAVEDGIRQRLSGTFNRPDEHWLQAVVRQFPSIVGVEQPALRELPAWRPHSADLRESQWNKKWGRGYVDIAGLDGHGNLRIVETKLSDNSDPLLVLQGLDYYIWSLALESDLKDRLGAPKGSKTEIHYVIGDTVDGKIKHSAYTEAMARSLHPSVPWQFQSVRNWFHPDGSTEDIESELFPPGVVPEAD
jgi:hypothetical protein